MKERLDILREGKVIDPDIADYTLSVYEDYIVKNNIEGDKSEMFLTHLAMASQRIRNNNIAEDMNDLILNDIKRYERFDKIEELANEILSDAVVEFPESEIKYLWLHLYNIINSQEK